MNGEDDSDHREEVEQSNDPLTQGESQEADDTTSNALEMEMKAEADDENEPSTTAEDQDQPLAGSMSSIGTHDDDNEESEKELSQPSISIDTSAGEVDNCDNDIDDNSIEEEDASDVDESGTSVASVSIDTDSSEEQDEKATASASGDDPPRTPIKQSLDQEWGDDPLSNALEMENMDEEVEQDDNPLTRSGVFSRDDSASYRPPERIPFLKALARIAHDKRDVFFALYFNLPQGYFTWTKAPPANPQHTYEVTFGEVWDAAGVVAYHLKYTWKVRKGQHVLLVYGYGPSALVALLGCFRAGVVAVPVEAPTASSDKNRLVALNRIANDCEPIAMVLTDQVTYQLRNKQMANPFGAYRKSWLSSLRWRATEYLKYRPTLQVLTATTYTFDELDISHHDIAMIQYTAGSTSDPRPVLISYGCLQASLDMCHRNFQLAFANTDGTPPIANVSGMSHLPLTEGWGLVPATLLPMTKGWRMYYMSPNEFAERPLQWLDRISQHKITWSIAHDPDYIKMAEAFAAAKQASKGVCPVAYLDLSNVRHWHTLGQHLRTRTHSLVTQELEEYGLCKSWYTASYGLSEHVAGALFLPKEFVTCKPGTVGGIDRVAVACRKSLDPKMIVKIVDPITKQEVMDGVVGELWLSSGAVAQGYYKMPELTSERFNAALSSASTQELFLRTGDAAFFEDDHLYICGTLEDAIKIDDRTYYPPDMECIETASTNIIPGCVVAFQMPENDDVVIVYEICTNHNQEPPFVCTKISKMICERLKVTPDRVVAVREGSIPKTASGKVRRKSTARELEEETLDVMYDAASLNDGTLLPFDSAEYMSRAQDFDNVMQRYFGPDYDENSKWEEMGLSSLASIDLRYDIASHSSVHMLSNCFELYQTPAELKEFVIQSHNRALPIKEPYIPITPSIKLSWLVMGLLQAVAAVIILLLFSASVLPVWYRWKYFAGSNLEIAGFPYFMGSYSFVVILAKWSVIGRYTSCRMSVPSFPYLRWWMVDRMVDLWEFWIGRFIVNTPLLNLFYILMGANVSMSADLDGFCREFDLITVGPHARLQHRSLRARKFSSWNRSDSGPIMTLRPIEIGSKSVVRGMLSPGVKIGKSSVIEKLAVVEEGTQVGDRVLVAGNPAVLAGRAPIVVHHNACVAGLLKVKWLLIEFWVFGVLILSSQWATEAILQEHTDIWVAWWAVFIPVFCTVCVMSSVAVKWILLGNRKPGKVAGHMLSEVADWAADYHFFLSTWSFQTFSLNSRFCNALLMVHGMDIDLASKVYYNSFPPSKMDFVHIRRSHVAGVSFDVKKYGAYYPTYIQESSIGESAHINAGLRLENAVIPPLSVVTAEMKKIAPHGYMPPEFSYADEVVVSFWYCLVIVCFKMSVFSAYQYWKIFAHRTPDWCVMFVFAGTIGIQSTIWMLMIMALQAIAFVGVSEDKPTPWSPSIYNVYLSSSEAFQTWSAVTVLWGTQLFNDIARLFGSSIEGRTLYFGNRMYDGPFLTVSNRTVADGSQLCGHSIIFEQVRLAPTKVAGILQEGTLAIASANVTAKQTQPWRPVVEKDARTSMYYHMSFSKDIEAPETVMV